MWKKPLWLDSAPRLTLGMDASALSVGLAPGGRSRLPPVAASPSLRQGSWSSRSELGSAVVLAGALALSGLVAACQGEPSSPTTGGAGRGLPAAGAPGAPGAPSAGAESAEPPVEVASLQPGSPTARAGSGAAAPGAPSEQAGSASSVAAGPSVPPSAEQPPAEPPSAEPAPPTDPRALACAEKGQAIYERRIAPVLADDRPKSCNQCHLAGVDLGLFVRETPCQTMACLQELELVDLADPQASTVLGWIGRAEPTSPLITAEVIAAEYDGFLEWIEHAAECGKYECAGVACEAGKGDPFCENELEPRSAQAAELDQGGCSELELERLFRNSVYASRGRCYPCHFSGDTRADPRAPRFIEQSGTCDQSSLVTMRNVINSGLVSVDGPSESLLLLKPLAESEGGVPHGGHDKFFGEEDPAYVNFLYWLSRYADCEGGAL